MEKHNEILSAAIKEYPEKVRTTLYSWFAGNRKLYKIANDSRIPGERDDSSRRKPGTAQWQRV